jgi:hypothetical protein
MVIVLLCDRRSHLIARVITDVTEERQSLEDIQFPPTFDLSVKIGSNG